MASQTNDIPGSGWGNVYVDSLIWGCGWTGAPVTYWFGSGDVPADESAIGAFTGYDWSGFIVTPLPTLFQEALAQYSAVCNLQFAQASSQGEANIVWWRVPNMDDGTLGLHDVPDATKAQLYGYFNAGDGSFSNPLPGSEGYVTIVHELGHALGLAHPQDGGDHPDATAFPGVTSDFSVGTNGMNQGIWTVMSYNDGWNKAPSPTMDWGHEIGPMALDIAALQAVYGANMTTQTGDDVYYLPNQNTWGTGFSCIWDAGGADTISNAGSSRACTINLNAAPLTGSNAGGYVSSDSGILGGFTIAANVLIENAIGGSGRDTLIGNAGNNVLDGGLGDDAMVGGAGDDTYYIDTSKDKVTELAGGGNDTIYSPFAVSLKKNNIENAVLTGSKGVALTGSDAANLLVGNAGSNKLSAGDGADTLVGGGGSDTLIGGSGADVFRFLDGDSGIGKLRDTIKDLSATSGDRIDLSMMDANSLADGLQHFSYIGSEAFDHVAGELRFASSVLSADLNGDGVADFEIALSGVRTFTADCIDGLAK